MKRGHIWLTLTTTALALVFTLSVGEFWGLTPGTAAGDELEVEPALRMSLESAASLTARRTYFQHSGTMDRASLRRVREVRIGNLITDLSPLAQCPDLQAIRSMEDGYSLRAMSNAYVAPLSLEPLRHTPHLRTLQLPFQGVGNISVFAHLRELREVDLSGCDVKDYSPLESLPQLQSLALERRGTGGFDSPGYGKQPPDRRDDIANLAEVELPGSLTWLSLAGLQLDSLDLVQNCSELTWLDAGGMWLTSIAPLRNCKKLRTVWLDRNPISDLEVLLELPELRSLQVIQYGGEHEEQVIAALRARGVRVNAELIDPKYALPPYARESTVEVKK